MHISSFLALIVSLASAQHAPVGDPTGNPFTRPLNEIVPACRPFTITWQPTTPNTVSLLLLRGPSNNAVPDSTLATGIANSGSFSWTPSASLEATSDSKYGLQLIDDVTGQYQYSTQFQLYKGPDCDNSPSQGASFSPVTASGVRSATSSSPSASLTASLYSSASFTASLSPSASPTSSTSPAAVAASSSSLNTGTKVGIALGAIFGVAPITLIVFLAYRLGKRKRQDMNLEDKPQDPESEDGLERANHGEKVAELHDEHLRELHHDERCELEQDDRREIDGLPVSELATPIAELEAKL